MIVTATCQEKYHIHTKVCQNNTVFDELKKVRFKKRPVCAPGIIQFAIMLRYISVQSYKLLLDEFRLSSLSLLRKIVTGDIDAVKSAKLLQDEEKMSGDACVKNIREVNLLVQPQMVSYAQVSFLL